MPLDADFFKYGEKISVFKNARYDPNLENPIPIPNLLFKSYNKGQLV